MKLNKPTFNQALAVLCVVSVLGFAIAFYSFPPQAQAVTMTITSTNNSTVSIISRETTTATLLQSNTVTSMVTVTSLTTETLTTFTKTLTENATFTITQQQPEKVEVSGQVNSKLPLTTATQIRFVAASGITYPATVTGGTYSVILPNNDVYQVNIDYSINPVGSGSCWAGQLPLDTMLLTKLLSWSCP